MKIAVVGGGASGMTAAYFASLSGADVTLFEKKPFCGCKLNITGKGRCNLTNNCSVDELIKNAVRNGRFLYSALSDFNSQDTMAFFEKAGVPLKTERGNRVFPVSDNAKDVSGALKTLMHRSGVKICYSRVTDIFFEKGKVTALNADGKRFDFDRIILATGGLSYPKTGSDGDGYIFAEKAGHTVTELSPSLVPLYAEGDIPARLEGLSLKNVSVSVFKNGKKVYSDFGEMLFTSSGVSGPIILSASSRLGRKDTFPYDLTIDLKPALDNETLDKRILSDFSEFINRDFQNSLSKLLPSKIIPVIIELSGISPSKKINAITKTEREKLVSLLKNFPLKITGFYPIEEAIVTSGGVSVKEIDPKTMQSKKVKGLYFCGEIIDIDSYTGGFNLQSAWATGHTAGVSAAVEDNGMKCFSVAIDGPSGAGKSTIAKAVAKKLNITYVDTGAIYRTVGLFVFRSNVSSEDAASIIKLLPEIKIEIKYTDGVQRIYLNGEDVSDKIRNETISLYASNVSKINEVRSFLLDLQRDIAKNQSVIMDGRDIGTVVLPDANVKIFLTASSYVRAQRRYKELIEKGEKVVFEEVHEAIIKRDNNDSSRAAAPLKQAEDAVLVDSSFLSLQETVDKIYELIRSKIS